MGDLRPAPPVGRSRCRSSASSAICAGHRRIFLLGSTGSALIAFLTAFAWDAPSLIAPLVFLETFGSSVTTASLVMLLRTGALTAAALLGGLLAVRAGARFTAVVGTTVMTIGLGVIAWGAGERSLFGFGAGLVLQGLGHGIALPPLNATVASAVPIEDVGVASAANRLLSQVGTAFGITLLTLGYSRDGGGAALSFLTGGALSVLSVAAAAFLNGREAVKR